MSTQVDGRPILVTGGAGFIGCNIADRLAGEGHEVRVYDALSRPGVERNLQWLKERHGAKITSVVGDVRDEDELVRAAADVKAVFHMAAQVAVTTILADPREDFEVNVRGTVNLLDAVRVRREPVPVIFASTNKVYGDFADLPFTSTSDRYEPEGRLRDTGIDESRPLDFHTPYGCSKGAADQYVLDYARSFGVPSAVLRMSCIYGPHQMGTEDQGWVAHFMIRAMRGEGVSIYGDGFQVRDVLHVQDAVAAYIAAWRRIGAVTGTAYNIGGGPANAVSLRQVLREIESVTGRRMRVEHGDWRAGDQRWYVSDTRRAMAELGLRAPTPWREGLRDLAGWLERRNAEAEPSMAAGA